MKKITKCISMMIAVSSIFSAMSVTSSAIRVPQKIVGSNTYETGDGVVEHEYIWEDNIFSSNVESSIMRGLSDASWIDIDDGVCAGKHRSAKEYTSNHEQWYACAETTLHVKSTNEAKKHYSRARIINGFMPWIIESDSGRQWGTGYSSAESGTCAANEPSYALRSYWGY